MLFSYSESLNFSSLDRELKAYANEATHVSKDLPIYILKALFL